MNTSIIIVIILFFITLYDGNFQWALYFYTSFSDLTEFQDHNRFRKIQLDLNFL